MSNSKNIMPELFATLTKENQDIVIQFVRLLNNADFRERFHALESEKCRPLSGKEIVSFMSEWAETHTSNGEGEPT